MTIHSFTCLCLIGGYVDHFKLFNIKKSAPEHTNEGEKNCLCLSQRWSQANRTVQSMTMCEMNKWMTVAMIASVVFARAHVRSCSEGPDQKWNCWVSESVGLLITLYNVQLHSEMSKFTTPHSQPVAVFCLSHCHGTILSDFLKYLFVRWEFCPYYFNYLPFFPASTVVYLFINHFCPVSSCIWFKQDYYNFVIFP